MGLGKNMVYKPFSGETAERIEIIKRYVVEDENNNLKYIVFQLRKILNDGKVVQFYKASSFFRLRRVSKESRENQAFMDIHTDIMRAMYASNICVCQIIANILKPQLEGLVYLYGVQATGNTPQEAMHYCSADFNAFLRTFQSTHRTDHIEIIDAKTIKWVLEKIQNQKYTTVIKGIPQTRQGSGQNKNIVNFDTKTSEQTEQFLVGASEIEFCLMFLLTPISQKYLEFWLGKSKETQTKWERQKQGSTTNGFNVGIPMSISMNNTLGTSSNVTAGTSTNKGTSSNVSAGTSENHGTSANHTDGTGTSSNTSHTEGTSANTGGSHSEGSGTSTTDGTSSGSNTSQNSSDSSGNSFGFGAFGSQYSHNNGHSNSTGYGTNEGESHSEGSSTNVNDGTSWGSGTNKSDSSSTGTSTNTSDSTGTSDSYGTSTNKSYGESNGTGTSNSSSTGMNASKSQGMSTGLNVGFNFSKSYQWVDKTVEYICQCLEMQNKRLEKMTEGNGGFFVDAYISTDSPENLKAMESLSIVTWVNPNAKIDALRLETPSRIGQKNILAHMLALSPCQEIVREEGGSGYYYKYSSILTSDETTAYTHPPRISIGGIDNSMEDIPLLRVPTDCQNKEIYLGHVINAEKYSVESMAKYGNGYVTDFKFGISNKEMHHAFISGGSRSGKSVLASRATLEMYKNAPYINKITNEKKHKRVFVLDPKGEWRQMASMIPKGKFKFYSVGKPNFHPLRLNLLRVPIGVTPYNYFNIVVEHFCSAYGLLDRAIAQISSIIYDLYEKNEVFGHEEDPKWANEHSKDITIEDIYLAIEKQMHESEARHINHDVEALQTYLTRLDMYHRKHSAEYIMFCNRGGASCDILLGDDDFTVVESNGLSEKSQRFFSILFMNSIYECALANGSNGFYNNKDQCETVIVLEEANSILIAAGSDDTSGQASINRFNQIIDKSASLGLFFWVITQKIASMPESVIANSGIIFAGRTGQGKDQDVIMNALGYDSRKDFNYKKFFARMAVGVFVGRVTKGMSFEEQTPFCLKSQMLKMSVPSDAELDILIKEHESEAEINRRDEIDDVTQQNY